MVQKSQKSKLNLYNIFVNFFLKKGKKQKIKKKIHESFIILSKKFNVPVNKILLKVIFSFYTFIEVKRVKARRRLNIIPFSVRNSRRYFLVFKKIQNILKKKKTSISIKFYTEFLNILKRRSRSKDLKSTNLTQAFSNRSNTHFRWFF
jgi:ribosomal protein S7